jgi:hypothetical protein
MKHRVMKKYGPLATLIIYWVLMTSCAAPNTTLRVHPDFAHHERRVRTILILPPDVHFEQTESSGNNERIPKQEKSISESLVQHTIEELTDRGYMVSEFQMNHFKASREDAGYQFSQVEAAYHQASDELYAKEATYQEALKYRVCLGPIVNQVSGESDAVLFIRYQGFAKSKRQLRNDKVASTIKSIVFMSLTGIYGSAEPVRSVGFVEMALVDGTTGDVLWCNRAAGANFGGYAAAYVLHGFPILQRRRN